VKTETLSFYESAVERALQHVVTHLDEALDLSQLARVAALSPFHFHRIFRGMLGETPLELHRRLRLERAALRLRSEGTTVTTIALAAGYDTHEAFTRAFSAHYGCSPSQARKLPGASIQACSRPFQIELPAPSGVHIQSLASRVASPLARGEASMNVTIESRPELRVFCVQHIGPYSRISEAFARLRELSGRAGLLQGRPTMLAVYHDDPESTPEAELHSDAAVVVPEGAALPAGLTELRIPGGRHAKLVHVGPYEELGDAWARLMGQWLPRSNERLGEGVTYEIYVNTPMEVPKEQLVTELYLPLAPA
jgi:AraC family transcriptional regulator